MDSSQLRPVLKFESFEFVHGILQLPKGFVIFRAVDPNFPLSHFPNFYSSFQVARTYVLNLPNREIHPYTPKRPMKLLDIRYVKSILPSIFYPSRCSSPEYLKIVENATVALGLCSFHKQIELLEKVGGSRIEFEIDRMKRFEQLPSHQKPAWANPIELQGVRCGITHLDYKVVLFLRELFGEIADGIIAPAMPSPYHNQISDGPDDIIHSKMYEELIIFRPMDVLEAVPTTRGRLQIRGELNIDEHIKSGMHNFTAVLDTPYTVQLRVPYIKQGGNPNPNPIHGTWALRDAVADALDAGDKALHREVHKSTILYRKHARRLKKSQVFLREFEPDLKYMYKYGIISKGEPITLDLNIPKSI